MNTPEQVQAYVQSKIADPPTAIESERFLFVGPNISYGSTKEQIVYSLPNRRFVSTIRFDLEWELWEAAVLDRGGYIDYTTPITSNVVTDLSDSGVAELITLVAALPEEP